MQNPQHTTRLVLLAMNLDGYHDLCQLVSRGYTEGFYYKPRVDQEILKQYSKNLIALTSSPPRRRSLLRFHESRRRRALLKIIVLQRIVWRSSLFGDAKKWSSRLGHSQSVSQRSVEDHRSSIGRDQRRSIFKSRRVFFSRNSSEYSSRKNVARRPPSETSH